MVTYGTRIGLVVARDITGADSPSKYVDLVRRK
jgi:hypothetical protein